MAEKVEVKKEAPKKEEPKKEEFKKDIVKGIREGKKAKYTK